VCFQDVHVDDDNADRTNIEDTPPLPTVNDRKKAKEEQKRLEKEERDREKKRKEEEKRQLKEQEKISKENARKEKSKAPTRKEERDENKRIGGFASFMFPSRRGTKPKNTVRGRVLLLDGSEIEIEIEVSILFLFTISEL